MKGEGAIMEKSKEKFGNYFGVRAVAFVLCVLLAGTGLWFLPHGMIELNKPSVQVSNASLAEMLSGEDYLDSRAFRLTAQYQLHNLLFAFDKAAKLPALEEVLTVLDTLDSPVTPANDGGDSRLRGNDSDSGNDSAADGVDSAPAAQNDSAAEEAITAYMEQLSYDDYYGSDLYYIVNGAIDTWVNMGERYFNYQISGEYGRVPVLEFDFERVKDNEKLFQRVRTEGAVRMEGDSGSVYNSGDGWTEASSEMSAGVPSPDETVVYEPLIALSSHSPAEIRAAGAFFAAFPEQTREILALWKALNADNWQTATANLDADGLRYFATDGKTVVTNIAALKNKTDFGSADFAQDPEYLSVRAGEVLETSAALQSMMSEWTDGHGPVTMSVDINWDDLSCFLSYPESALAAQRTAYEAKTAIMRNNFIPAAACAALSLLLLILLLVWTGRKRADGTRHAYLWDKFFMEGQVVIILLSALGAVFALDWFSNASAQSLYYYWPGGADGGIASSGSLLLIGAMTALAAAFVWCLLSIVRNLKALTFVRRSLIGLLCLVIGKGVRELARAIRSGFEERNPLTKTVGLVAALWFLTALCAGVCGISVANGGGLAFPVSAILLIVLLVAAIYFTLKWVARYGRLRRGIEEVSVGNVNYRIEVPEGSRAEFDVLSRRVNEISGAIQTAVESELKNQRLKTDLISNVSHDLKTPLTSIITYTDLLKKEGLRSKNAAEYLDVLEEKGQRLKKLTDDLFEAAKASSGAVPAYVERVDLLSLVRQEIAETETLFAANGLEVITDAPDEHYYVSADGNLLWRVMENIFRNAGKYALAGSRVYIDLRRETRGPVVRIVFTMKNISAEKLNIPAEELMERFKRGDENRTTEGSGLGLAIARDLVRLQQGHFDIVIDGDLFKAVIELTPFEE
ncbi:hypothetical protein AGMMS49983_07860 [Clostridia bacterium]|nr:hypothetical protein AGMMS49983_07860 [Clostridia bacterium]